MNESQDSINQKDYENESNSLQTKQNHEFQSVSFNAL
jgi:hypothetical protein